MRMSWGRYHELDETPYMLITNNDIFTGARNDIKTAFSSGKG